MEDQNVVYKVVEKGTRWCSNWMLIKTQFLERGRDFQNAITWRKAHKEWFPRYLCGNTIRKAPGSVGILTFSSEQAAEHFCLASIPSSCSTKIIKVAGIGPANQNIKIVDWCNCTDILCKRADSSPPPGTVAYDAVEVLE